METLREKKEGREEGTLWGVICPRARGQLNLKYGEGAQNDNLVCLGAATADQNFAHSLSLSYRHFSSISFFLVSFCPQKVQPISKGVPTVVISALCIYEKDNH